MSKIGTAVNYVAMQLKCVYSLTHTKLTIRRIIIVDSRIHAYSYTATRQQSIQSHSCVPVYDLYCYRRVLQSVQDHQAQIIYPVVETTEQVTMPVFFPYPT